MSLPTNERDTEIPQKGLSAERKEQKGKKATYKNVVFTCTF